MVTIAFIRVFPCLILIFQFRLACKEENAHDVSIWSCDWGKLKPKRAGKEGDNADASVGEGKATTEEPPLGPERDIIVTGGLDDVVKVWDFDDNELRLRQTLTGHSLGIVSVAISSDGQSEYNAVCQSLSLPLISIFTLLIQQSPAAPWTRRCAFGKRKRANC